MEMELIIGSNESSAATAAEIDSSLLLLLGALSGRSIVTQAHTQAVTRARLSVQHLQQQQQNFRLSVCHRE